MCVGPHETHNGDYDSHPPENLFVSVYVIPNQSTSKLKVLSMGVYPQWNGQHPILVALIYLDLWKELGA